ncbi:hypothetical protein M407DRAFT_244671 [Tulasnella calospora MUT 4182]|uniref:Uncharacterized protein n=1 Tax=Tulasnella calospora MUT 4182 TaxID=1051891 RepID=A0A0C3Q4D9_9AGAM|nr:hypothetical protein M407DRAFT_244671 [Tulasnella calospora MUT 4182]
MKSNDPLAQVKHSDGSFAIRDGLREFSISPPHSTHGLRMVLLHGRWRVERLEQHVCHDASFSRKKMGGFGFDFLWSRM